MYSIAKGADRAVASGRWECHAAAAGASCGSDASCAGSGCSVLGDSLKHLQGGWQAQQQQA